MFLISFYFYLYESSMHIGILPRFEKKSNKNKKITQTLSEIITIESQYLNHNLGGMLYPEAPHL